MSEALIKATGGKNGGRPFRPPTFQLIVISLLALAVLASIGIWTVAEPGTRTASANCNSCHSSSIYETVQVKAVNAPATIESDLPADVTADVEVRASHKSSTYTGFKMTVSIASTNGMVTVPGSQVLNNQVVSGAAAPYTWTRTFVFTVTGALDGVDDLRVTATMDVYHQSPPVSDSLTDTTEVVTTDHAPVISLPMVTPSTGGPATQFSYSVKYTDEEGDPPSYAQVVIDGTDRRDLSIADGQGTPDHAAGVVYEISGIALPLGAHTYHFEASDGTKAVRDPPGTDVHDGPEVMEMNSPPSLFNGTVTPQSGEPGEIFTFKVVYLDLDGQAPIGGLKLLLDDDSAGVNMFKDLNAAPDLHDSDITNGEAYSLDVYLEEGTHHFSFNATDGEAYASLGPFTGPMVSTVPVLAADIISPTEGSSFVSDDVVDLEGRAMSNVEVSDANLSWSSNISGVIGHGASLSIRLALGHHLITLDVTSEALGLSAEDTLNISVTQDLPDIEVVSSSPEDDDVEVYENRTLRFSVELTVRAQTEHSVRWELDGGAASEGPLTFDYTPGYIDSGPHTVKVTVQADEYQFQRTWNVEVIDRWAPIILEEAVDEFLGVFEAGESLFLTVPVSDHLGRELTASWSIDGAEIGFTGLDLDLLLWWHPYAEEGGHVLQFIAENPDGTRLHLNFTYEVAAYDWTPVDDTSLPGGGTGASDDDGKGPGRGPIGRGGIIIVLAGTFGVVSGITYCIIVLARKGAASRAPETAPTMEAIEIEEDWDAPPRGGPG